MLICKQCHSQNPDTVTHCIKCGALLTPSQPLPPPPPPTYQQMSVPNPQPIYQQPPAPPQPAQTYQQPPVPNPQPFHQQPPAPPQPQYIYQQQPAPQPTYQPVNPVPPQPHTPQRSGGGGGTMTCLGCGCAIVIVFVIIVGGFLWWGYSFYKEHQEQMNDWSSIISMKSVKHHTYGTLAYSKQDFSLFEPDCLIVSSDRKRLSIE